MSEKVYIETYGCQMNEYDTDIVRSFLKQGDFALAASPQEARVILLNTCAVRENAHQRIYGRLDQFRRLKEKQPELVIGILGCMAQNLKEDLLERGRIVDLVAGPDSYRRLPEMIRQVRQTLKPVLHVDLSEYETYSDICPEQVDGVNAWVAVMRGCDNFCTFCVVPYTRGRERSRDPDSVVQEVEVLAMRGYKQITLLGQNVNSYRAGSCDFAGLMERVSEVEGIQRVRFTSPHPKDFPDSLLRVIAENPKICKHIHLPLQAGSDRILHRMNRTYSREEFLLLVRKIRELCPEMGLTTDIIVGFPTETEEEFLDTCRVMEEVEFDSAFLFQYSERKGTTAARKWPDDVPDEVKGERLGRLVELQRRISLRKNQQKIGREVLALVEKESKKSAQEFMGRGDDNRTVVFPRNGTAPGELVRVRITGATSATLLGEVASAER
ncbi:MAG: tRNA (N6-isopentenyl adenosine(37)-C2)-methylthiotransferase MiaB [Candidatus Tectomicrobia bacterium]|uniref:tRNA-2-methylthio-N(6)-dimethylallyladenosine synthase n=1 Tax=Tectimicrobiota bacterium TaxID=2528274 RepID=A0A932GQC1_UNCTE|nr:tRNA (N6-isopentenyl adenosine(37)-C2)-methylthiotransferase MiaB [Candidatus Tectomicrobia bacterium]